MTTFLNVDKLDGGIIQFTPEFTEVSTISCNAFYIEELGILVDFGAGKLEMDPPSRWLFENNLPVHGLVLTHTHGDHFGAPSLFPNMENTPIYMSEKDSSKIHTNLKKYLWRDFNWSINKGESWFNVGVTNELTINNWDDKIGKNVKGIDTLESSMDLDGISVSEDSTYLDRLSNLAQGQLGYCKHTQHSPDGLVFFFRDSNNKMHFFLGDAFATFKGPGVDENPDIPFSLLSVIKYLKSQGCDRKSMKHYLHLGHETNYLANVVVLPEYAIK